MTSTKLNPALVFVEALSHNSAHARDTKEEWLRVASPAKVVLDAAEEEYRKAFAAFEAAKRALELARQGRDLAANKHSEAIGPYDTFIRETQAFSRQLVSDFGLDYQGKGLVTDNWLAQLLAANIVTRSDFEEFQGSTGLDAGGDYRVDEEAYQRAFNAQSHKFCDEISQDCPSPKMLDVFGKIFADYEGKVSEQTEPYVAKVFDNDALFVAGFGAIQSEAQKSGVETSVFIRDRSQDAIRVFRGAIAQEYLNRLGPVLKARIDRRLEYFYNSGETQLADAIKGEFGQLLKPSVEQTVTRLQNFVAEFSLA